MPKEQFKSKDVVRAAFVKMLSSRYTAAMAWNGFLPIEQLEWPEWSPQAFQRERQEWLALSEMTVHSGDGEVRHWGRYARLAASRVQQQGWQSPQAPLRHARTQLWAARLLDPDNALGVTARTFAGLPEWIDRLNGQSGADSFVQAQTAGEAEYLAALADRAVKDHVGGEGFDPQAVRASLTRYQERVRSAEWQGGDIPWCATAHVDTWKWHQRRKAFGGIEAARRQGPYQPIEAWVRDVAAALGGSLPGDGILVPQLGSQSWVRLAPSAPAWYYGPRSHGSVLLSSLLLWWRRQSPTEPLTWMLSAPPAIEGGIQMLGEAFGPQAPAPVALWAQRHHELRRLLALGDAWLWLEGAGPEAVLRWLQPFLGPEGARRWVLRLKTDPGRIVAACELQEQQEAQYAGQGINWPGWSDGPVRWGEL